MSEHTLEQAIPEDCQFWFLDITARLLVLRTHYLEAIGEASTKAEASRNQFSDQNN